MAPPPEGPPSCRLQRDRWLYRYYTRRYRRRNLRKRTRNDQVKLASAARKIDTGMFVVRGKVEIRATGRGTYQVPLGLQLR